MSRRRTSPRTQYAALLLLVACPAPGLSGVPVLDTLQLPAEVQAVATSSDGTRAAVALPPAPGRGSPRTLLRLHSIDNAEALTIKIGGLVRDLLFSDDDSSIYVLEHRPAKRGGGQSFLLRIDLSDLKIEKRLRLPPTARGIEPWSAGPSLLIPARNEIRTISLPLLRSGPLFRVPGENLCVAVAGGSRVLIGQETALLVVDLSDPQGREGMPVRRRVATRAPVVSIDVDDGGLRAVARLADGSQLSLSLDKIEPAEEKTVPPVAAEAPPPPPVAPPVAAAPEPARAAEEETVEVQVEVQSQVQVQVQGTIHDAPDDLPISVVFLGPDNLLREAARIRADSAGRWQASGLAAGRYRVQLDAGGARALITDPPFRTLEIGEPAGPTLTADFRVAGVL